MIYENGKQVYDIFNGDIFEVEGEHSGEEFICVSTMQTNNGNFRAKDRDGRLFWFNTVTDTIYILERLKDASRKLLKKESKSVNKLYISEMTSDEQREKVKQLKVEIRDMMQQIDFERIPEATMAMYETDTKGFRESLIEWAIHCDGDMGHWTTEKIYVGSLEGKSPILYKFNRALSVVMLTTGNGIVVNIAKSGSTRLDPPWTKLDALERLHDWLSEYLTQ
jgi:hypothetical protein